MHRTLRTPALAAGAALALAAAATAPAPAQVIGLPTGGEYSPYDTFAERWYDPGDWYGGPARVGVGVGVGVGAPARLGSDPIGGFRGSDLGRRDPRGLGTEVPPARTTPDIPVQADRIPGAGLDAAPGAASPYGMRDLAGSSVPGGSPLFQRGDSPYDSRPGRDFYDTFPGRARATLGANPAAPAPAATPGVPDELAGPDPVAAAAEAGGLDAPAPGSTAARPGAAVAPDRTIRRSARPAGYGGLYGDYDYLERGALARPSYGVGPRYRGYYSDDWYSDSAAFDDWYDDAPTAGPPIGAEVTPAAPGPLEAPAASEAPAAPLP